MWLVLHSQEQEAREQKFRKPEESNFASEENYPSRFKQWNIWVVLYLKTYLKRKVTTERVCMYTESNWNITGHWSFAVSIRMTEKEDINCWLLQLTAVIKRALDKMYLCHNHICSFMQTLVLVFILYTLPNSFCNNTYRQQAHTRMHKLNIATIHCKWKQHTTAIFKWDNIKCLIS